MSKKTTEMEEARAELHKLIAPGTTVYTLLRHRAPSGMTRWIDLYIMQDNAPRCISWIAARAMQETYDRKRECIKVGGCGMDMGYHLVYGLSRTLFKDTFQCVGKGCPSNDHSNGDRNYEPHQHSDGGYALNHRWM